ncbi:MAG: indolepyruvate ferredoxin oxidoreductase family protein, partial [Acidobacteriota bacterium]
MAVIDYELSDRYLKDEGRVFLTGVQALARIPVEQLRADRRDRLHTAAFVSGYPGSPLGGFDQEVARAAALADDLPIVCEPGVNEELGATAVMGSQLAATQPDFRYDGVLGLWYGKAPGLDRAGDALRHAAFAGTSRHGGAIALVGDDPAAKSSTLPSSSDATIYDLHMPLFYPGDVQETIDLARHAVALSRMTGTWTAMKIVAAVADGSGTVDLSADGISIVTPDLSIPGDPTGRIYEPTPNGNLLTPTTLELERDFRDIRLILAQRYASANRLNHTTADPSDAWIGLVASGYTYHELLEA